MSLTEVKKELKKLEKTQLIDLIADLYSKNKSNKEYLDFFANPNEEKLLETYKQKVELAFFPKRGYKFKLADGKKAISDFKKISPSAESLADLMLVYAENGVKAMRAYGGYLGEPFHISVENTFIATLKLLKKEKLLPKFHARAKKVVADSAHTGSGTEDVLTDAFRDHYPKG